MSIYRREDNKDLELLSIEELMDLYEDYDIIFNDLNIMNDDFINNRSFFELFNYHYVLEFDKNDRELYKNFGIDCKKIKTKYCTYNKQKYAYGDRIEYLFEDWYVYSNKDIDENKVYNDNEIKNMIFNKEIVLLNKSYRKANVLDYELTVDIDNKTYYKTRFEEGIHKLTSCNIDEKEYNLYSSEELMGIIRNRLIAIRFIDSEMDYYRFKANEIVNIVNQSQYRSR